MKIRIEQDYRELRRCAYPDLAEQVGNHAKLLDAIIEVLTPQQRAKLPPEALAGLEEVRAIKARIPKKPEHQR